MSKILKIHVWLPDIFLSKGGIQVYSAFLIQALEQVLPNSDRCVFLKNDAKATEDIKFNPKTKFYFAGQYKSTPFHTIVFAFQVLFAAFTNKPDLIICGHINFSPLACQISNLLGIPYWVIVHGIDVWNLKNLDRIKGLKNSDTIISVSQYTANRIVREQSIPSEKISILANTFDPSKFTIQAKPQYLLDRYRLLIDQPVILTVARLAGTDRYKGYDQLLQALPLIRQQIPNIHYLLVGKGNDRGRIEKLIEKIGIKDYVTLTGFIPDEELRDHYNLCDVFAMPSKGEGFGIVYLEAMACGKPCLGGNQDGAIDALCHGKLGALVDPDNIEEIANTLIQILRKEYPNPILYQPEALRQEVIRTFGFSKFKENLSVQLSKFI